MIRDKYKKKEGTMKKNSLTGALVCVFAVLVVLAFCSDGYSGSLGVGVTEPLYNVDVSSSGALRSQLHFSKDGTDLGGWLTSVSDNNFFVSSGAVYDSSLGGWLQKAPDGKSVFAGSGAAGYTVFVQQGTPVNGVIAAAARLRIDFNGNVGIGTTTPQGKLDVNGAIYQRGTRLHADYVFEPAYKMESIEEHAKYMWENKHLKAVAGVTKDENGLEIVEVGAHQRGILEELEKAHVYIEQLHAKLNDKTKILEELIGKMDFLEAELKSLKIGK